MTTEVSPDLKKTNIIKHILLIHSIGQVGVLAILQALASHWLFKIGNLSSLCLLNPRKAVEFIIMSEKMAGNCQHMKV